MVYKHLLDVEVCKSIPPLKSIRFARACSKCGEQVRDGDKFCPQCGHKYDRILEDNMNGEQICAALNKTL